MVPALPRQLSILEDQIVVENYVDELIPEDACGGFLQCIQPVDGCWSTVANMICDPFLEGLPKFTKDSGDQPVVAMTEEEILQLDKIVKLVTHNYSLDQQFEEEKKMESYRSLLSATGNNCVLLELAKAGAIFSIEAACKQLEREIPPPLDMGKNPEAKFAYHLNIAKEKDKIKQRRQHHMKRVELLIKAYPNLLQHPFESCWFILDHVLDSTGRNHGVGDSASAAAFRSMIMESWLGNHNDVLDFLLGLSDLEDNPIYDVINICFYLSVAHAFLTVRDIDQQEMLMKLMEELNEAANDDKINLAVEAMLQDFQSFQKTKQKGHNANEIAAISSITTASAALPTAQEREIFLEWHKMRAPGLLSALPLCMHAILFPNLREEATKGDHWLMPFLDRHDEGSLLSDGQQSWLFTLACALPPRLKTRTMMVGDHPRWNQLYLSNTQGFDMKALEQSLIGYQGPTVLLVEALDQQTKTYHTFGAFASKPWVRQSRPEYFGNGDSFLFELKPNFRVFRAKPASLATYQYFQYYFIDQKDTFQYFFLGRKKDKNKPASGLGLGGNRRRPRFFISADLKSCHFGPTDSTFEEDRYAQEQQQINQASSSSPPSSNNEDTWKLLSLEIWGVGGESAMEALSRHRTIQQGNHQPQPPRSNVPRVEKTVAFVVHDDETKSELSMRDMLSNPYDEQESESELDYTSDDGLGQALLDDLLEDLANEKI